MNLFHRGRGGAARLRKVLAAAAALALIAGCSSEATGSSGEKTTLRLGFSAWPGWFPWQVAQEQGLFAKNGLTVDLKYFESYTGDFDDVVKVLFGHGASVGHCGSTSTESVSPLYDRSAATSSTASRTARTSSATHFQAFERWKVTSSLASRPCSWNQSACSSPIVAPHTAFAAVSRS